MKGIDGKVALVTGASRGIGEAVARRLAAAGARVAISARNLEPLQMVVDSIAADGGTAFAHTAHNGRMDQVAALHDAVVAELGPVDILVNNVGTNIFSPLLDVTEKLWDSLFATNLKGNFFLAQQVARGMLERGGGAIVNVSSVAGLDPMMGMGTYGATKAAMNLLTKTMATEWGPGGVRVNAVAPGVIDTKFAAMLVQTPAIRDKVLEDTPLKRIGEADDVAGAVVFLCSDDARHVTGHLLTIDGGMTGY